MTWSPRKANVSKLYYQLVKPGIVYGNVLTALAGFFFAATDTISWPLFFATMCGLALIVASACVFNNVFDRNIDALMERTKDRALVTKQISPRSALLFGAILGILGVKLLWFFTDPVTLGVALFGWVVYVLLYTPLKHKTGFSLFVGAVAGAVPPVVGYTAVTHVLDSTALLLFCFLFVWQLAHFIAIAVYRYDEYTNAHIPLLITHAPSTRARRIARLSFYVSLVVILIFAIVLSII